MTTVTLTSSAASETGEIRQTITDGKIMGHRVWVPGTAGPEAGWTEGAPPADSGFDSHIVVRTVLAPGSLEQRAWRGPLHSSAYSVRRRLEVMRKEQEAALEGTPMAAATSSRGAAAPAQHGGIDFNLLIPKKKRYVKVKWKGIDAFRVLDRQCDKQGTVLIEGETGEGKTFTIEQWAAAKGKPVIKVSGNAGANPDKYLGYDIIQNGSVVPQLGLIPQALLRGDCVILLDELGFFPPEMLTPLYPVLDGSRLLTLEFGGGISIPVPDDVLISATNNPGYEGVFAENHALRRRFTFREHHELPDSVIRRLITQPSVRSFAKDLRTSFKNEKIGQWLPLPTVLEFVEFAKDFGVDFAVDNLITLYVDESDRAVARQAFKTVEANLKDDFRVVGEATTEEPTVTETSEGEEPEEEAAEVAFDGL